MKILATILQHMIRFACISLLLLILFACFSCDDEKLESSTVRFTGQIQNSDFSPAPNTKFGILIRSNPNFNPDTTTMVRFSMTTDMSGQYDTTVHTDGFPPIPFYTIYPIADSLVSLETGLCPPQPFYRQILPNNEAITNVRFGAASYIKINFHKTEESTATSLRFATCTETISTSILRPDTTYVLRLPYDASPNPYPVFYSVVFGDFFLESRSTEVPLLPYDTTHVVIEY
jgi:hypothetical protein